MAAEKSRLTVPSAMIGARRPTSNSAMSGIPLPSAIGIVLAAALFAAAARAQTPPPPALTDAAKAMIGAWEISNAAKDKVCAVAFKAQAAAGGLKLEFDPPCTAFPSLKDVVVWSMGPTDNVRLLDGKGAVVLDFAEVESGMYEAERRGEGLFFLRSQAAIRATTVTPEDVFGEWTLLQEIDKPLCKLTLSNTSAGEERYRIVVKPGCVAAVAAIGFATWQLEANELMLVGRAGTWRFSESDPTTWERIPPSTEPMLLMKQ
jgi:Protease inhibitor Inh